MNRTLESRSLRNWPSIKKESISMAPLFYLIVADVKKWAWNF